MDAALHMSKKCMLDRAHGEMCTCWGSKGWWGQSQHQGRGWCYL